MGWLASGGPLEGYLCYVLGILQRMQRLTQSEMDCGGVKHYIRKLFDVTMHGRTSLELFLAFHKNNIKNVISKIS